MPPSHIVSCASMAPLSLSPYPYIVFAPWEKADDDTEANRSAPYLYRRGNNGNLIDEVSPKTVVVLAACVVSIVGRMFWIQGYVWCSHFTSTIRRGGN